MEKSKVYFTKEITPQSLVKIYEALNVELKGTSNNSKVTVSSKPLPNPP